LISSRSKGLLSSSFISLLTIVGTASRSVVDHLVQPTGTTAQSG
jgi:hypothetical protein